MSYNIIGPLPKKSDAPSKNFEKASGGLDNIEDPLVTNIDTVDKEVESRKNVVEEANTSPLSENNNIDIVKKTEKSQTFKETFHTSKKINPTHLTQ